ncbi:olfactory receptor 14A16-like [Vipera latastei]
MENQTTVPYFLLLEFSKNRQLQLLHFFFFFVLYLATLTTNLLIISAVAFDHRLHSPMYFFLMNLALQDLGIVSVIVPKSMINSLLDTRHISYFGCVAQYFFFLSFEASDFSLLTVMAYDRYIAICDPLHYETIMDRKSCLQLAAMTWITSLLYSALHTCGTFAITFCSNVLNQFFCEIPQLLKVSCDNSYLIEVGIIMFSTCIVFPCFGSIIVSYVQIFKSVFRISNLQRQNKAFSTCIPHLIVVILFISTGSINYLKLPSDSPSNVEMVITVFYSLVPPLMNPIVYTMRNREIQAALCNMFKSGITSRNQS